MIKVFLTALLFILSACTSPQAYIKVKKTDNVRVLYEQGTGVIISEKKYSSISMAPYYSSFPSQQTLPFIIAVKNNAKTEINFSTDNITAKSADGNSLHVYSYEEITAVNQKKRAKKEFSARLSAALTAMQTQQNAGTIYQNGTFGGFAGGTPYNGNYSGTTYSPLLQQLATNNAIDRGKADINRVVLQNQSLKSQEDSEALRMQTIKPNSTYGGVFVIDAPSLAQPIQIEAEVGKEKHQFQFDYGIIKEGM